MHTAQVKDSKPARLLPMPAGPAVVCFKQIDIKTIFENRTEKRRKKCNKRELESHTSHMF
jgi:hypothetical protein